MSNASTPSGLDRAVEVRQGEELDRSKLLPYLQDHISGLGKDPVIKQFPAGHSNLTYLIQAEEGEYVLRRPPFGAKVKSGHDMGREFHILTALADVLDLAPRPVLFCEDEEVLGAPFYVMERVKGVILRGPNPKGVDLSQERMRVVCEQFVQTLVQIHGVDLGAASLDDFGRPEGYIERQVSGWTQRWMKSATDEIRAMDEVAHWLMQNLPEEGPPSLIHNDFKYDNLVLSPDLGKVLAVLDWEMATVGDPLMDLGTTLAYWVEAEDDDVLQQLRFGPTTRPGNFTRRQLVSAYEASSGRSVSEIVFYYVYGLFKVAVVGQQIYYRYKHGHTSDERFAGLIIAVQALAQKAADVIDDQSIGT